MIEQESKNTLSDHSISIENLDLCLMDLITQSKCNQSRSPDYQAFQLRIDQCIREHDNYLQKKHAHDLEDTRRLQALCAVATIPLSDHLEHLDSYVLPAAPEEILLHCAAGITACWHMGQDLILIRKFISGYLVLLSEVFSQANHCQTAAAELIAQAYLFRSLLASQLEGRHAGINYYLKALKFGEIANIPAQSSIPGIYPGSLHRYGKQPEQILKRFSEAVWLLKPTPPPSDFLLIYDYMQEAVSQAYSLFLDEADLETSEKQDVSSKQRDLRTVPSPIDYASIALNHWERMTQHRLKEYARALDDFTKQLEPICDAPEPYRLGFLPNRALAALRLHDMDQAVTCLRAAIPQIMSFGNEQELVQAREAYHLMQFLLTDNPNAPTPEPKNLFKKHD